MIKSQLHFKNKIFLSAILVLGLFSFNKAYAQTKNYRTTEMIQNITSPAPTITISFKNTPMGCTGNGNHVLSMRGYMGYFETSKNAYFDIISENGYTLQSRISGGTACGRNRGVNLILDKDSINAWAADGQIDFIIKCSNAVITGCTSRGGGGPYSISSMDFNLMYEYVPKDDISVTGIFTPQLPICDLDSTVKIELKNYGNNTIDSAEIHWSVNGIAQNTFKWTGTINPYDKSTITIGMYNFSNGDSLKIWSENPNGISDQDPTNDTTEINNIQASLDLSIPNVLGMDTALCSGDSIQLGYKNMQGVFTWSTGAKTSAIMVNSPGVYTINGNSICGQGIDSIKVVDGSVTASFTSTTNNLTTSFFAQPGFHYNYDWDFDDGNQSTQQNPVHTYASNGTYNVTLKVKNECGTKQTSKKVSIGSTGIEEISAVHLSIQPNPNNGKFVLQLDKLGSKQVHVSIVDIQGKKVFENKFKVGSNSERKTIQLHEVPGIYILKALAGNRMFIEKIVISQ